MTSNTQREIQDIDAEIQSLEARLHKLRIRRNVLSTACMLPGDILAHIFRNLKEFRDLSDCPLDTVATTRLWYTSSLACRRWHDVVTGMRELWSHIELWNRAPLPWIELCISRARNSPLTFHVFLQNENCEESCRGHNCDTPCDHGHCNWHGTDSCRWHSYDNTLIRHLVDAQHVDRMEELRVYNACGFDDDSEPSDNPSIHLLIRDLLRDVKPSFRRLHCNDPLSLVGHLADSTIVGLQELRLQQLDSFTDIPINMPSLTLLELSFLGDLDYESNTMILSDLMKLLHSASQLEVLVLQCVSNITPRMQIIPEESMDLQHLRRLSLDGPISFLAKLLRVLPLPRQILQLVINLKEKLLSERKEEHAHEISFIHSQVIGFWANVASQQPLAPSLVNDIVIVGLRMHDFENYTLVFSDSHGACGVFYQAECQNAFKPPFQRLPKDDVLLGQIGTMVLYGLHDYRSGRMAQRFTFDYSKYRGYGGNRRRHPLAVHPIPSIPNSQSLRL
jgi:hypothetical protein